MNEDRKPVFPVRDWRLGLFVFIGLLMWAAIAAVALWLIARAA
jgi:hypothetical protein